MQRFFISYSAIDGKAFAERLACELEASAPTIPVWIDKAQLSPVDADWDDQIDRAIMDCKGLLLALTPDSVRQGSVCKNEWVSALSYKKPIIPLLVHPKAKVPFRLNSREYLDFCGDFDPALAKLRHHIAWMDSPAGQLRSLQHRLADAERTLPRTPPERQAQVEADIAELQRQIAAQQAVLDDPDGAQARVESSIAAGLENERRPPTPSSAPKTSKFINPPPLVAPSWFQNRQAETAQLASFLQDEALRAMAVVGRGGVGKSALVCRLLRALEGGQLPDGGGPLAVDGIVYLSAARAFHRLTLPDLYDGLTRLLPEAQRQALDLLYKNPQTTPQATAEALAAAFTDGLVVVLLDNFEDVVDSASGEIRDAELDAALKTLLLTSPHRIKLILTTRQSPAALAQAQPALFRRLDLDRGLDSPYAENILRAMDADGKVGLRDAPDALLAEARERTRGNPRALEHLFGILSADRDTRLEDILAKTRRYLPEQIEKVLVGEAFGRLDPLARQVMQALAIYRYPVPAAALDYMLHPRIAGVDCAPVLSRLYNMQFVSRDGGRYSLHRVDRDYALERLPLGSAADRGAEPLPATAFGLRHRAAEWFKLSRKPRDDWKSLQDLGAQLAEFELRCDSEDFDTAAALLLEFDFDYLYVWGHYRLMAELHQRLQDHIGDPWLALCSLNSLGTAHYRMGQIDLATTCYSATLAHSRAQQNRSAEGTAIGNLAACAADRGDLREAINYLEQSLPIHREVGDTRGEAIDLGSLANRHVDLGEDQVAIDYYQQALRLELEKGYRREEAADQFNIGNSYRHLGLYAEAETHFTSSLKTAQSIGFGLIEGAASMGFGDVALDLRQWAQAAEHFRHTITIGDCLNSTQLSKYGRIGLALALVGDAQLDLAWDTIDAAQQLDFPPINHVELALRGVVALRRADLATARNAFQASADSARNMIQRCADNFAAHDSLALAAAGLALCGETARLTDARAAYIQARQRSKGAGVITRVLVLLDALAPTDPQGLLAALRPVATGLAST